MVIEWRSAEGDYTRLPQLAAELPTGYHVNALENLKAAAPSLAIEPIAVSARTAEEVGPAFETMSRAHPEAAYVVDCPP